MATRFLKYVWLFFNIIYKIIKIGYTCDAKNYG